MSRFDRAVQLLAADIDDTILGNAAGADEFRNAWESTDAKDRPLLVYNGGRSASDIQELALALRVPTPEFIIGAQGTEIHDPLDRQTATDFRAHIATGWDTTAVERIIRTVPDARPQSAEFQNPCKSSWLWPRAGAAELARLELKLRDAGFDATVTYSANVFLDVIPQAAGKGNALAWLCHRIGVPLANVLVAGANANNSAMFKLAGVRGILPGNASRELFEAAGPTQPFVTPEIHGHGVMAGLRHFGVFAPKAEHANSSHFRPAVVE